MVIFKGMLAISSVLLSLNAEYLNQPLLAPPENQTNYLQAGYIGPGDDGFCDVYDAQSSPPFDLAEVKSFEEAEVCIFLWLEATRDIEKLLPYFVSVGGRLEPASINGFDIQKNGETRQVFQRTVAWPYTSFPFDWGKPLMTRIERFFGTGPGGFRLQMKYLDDGSPHIISFTPKYK